MEMAERARYGLEDHLSYARVGLEAAGFTRGRTEAKCRGCRSFPQRIDREVFDSDGKDYEFFSAALSSEKCSIV